MKKFRLGEKVLLNDSSDLDSTGTVVGTATIFRNGELRQCFLVELDVSCQGYICRNKSYAGYSSSAQALEFGGFVSTVVVHPDNMIRIDDANR